MPSIDQVRPARIMPLSRIRAWRKAVGRADGTLSVVTGSFALLHPGNLGAIREAARHGTHVCVILHAGANGPDTAAARTEMAAGLRGVSAVAACTTRAAEPILARLRPFTLVDCMAQDPVPPIASAARALADRIVDLPPLQGCFTAELQAAIRAGRTPLRLSEIDMPPAPNARTLAHWLRTEAARPLVTVNGCFDILHPGHVRLLNRARALGRRLVVLVNDDESVRAYKGQQRPVFSIRCRLAALGALEAVSLAVPFAGDTPLTLLRSIRPERHVKGGSFDPARVQAERDLLARWGGRLSCLPLLPGFSTTRALAAIRQSRPAGHTGGRPPVR